MKINNKEVNAKQFAYDGCHKIYIIEDDSDLSNAKEIGYNILDINELKETFLNSCELRFISDWKLTKYYVQQFENAVFED